MASAPAASSSSSAAAAPVEASRPRVGQIVKLTDSYASMANAAQGPLKPGDVGTVLSDDRTSQKPFSVKASDGQTWWYMADAIQVVDDDKAGAAALADAIEANHALEYLEHGRNKVAHAGLAGVLSPRLLGTTATDGKDQVTAGAAAATAGAQGSSTALVEAAAAPRAEVTADAAAAGSSSAGAQRSEAVPSGSSFLQKDQLRAAFAAASPDRPGQETATAAFAPPERPVPEVAGGSGVAAAGAEAFVDAEEEFEASLQQLVVTDSLQWIFVGGKGGVGKTTTSCSLAIELASRRESVLLLSTDPAHNISDAFCQKFSNTPSRVSGFKNLFAMEIDASYQESVEYKLKKEDGFGKVMQELIGAFPGVDEAMGFAELMQSVQSMPYSVIVFDTAPTGHTLRLLGFPELLEKGLSKLGSLQGKFGGMMTMIQSLADGGEAKEEEVHQKVNNLRQQSGSVRELFQDPSRCTFVCVCIPEFLSVYETERLIQELCKHGIDSSNIVVNQVLFPEDCGGDEIAITDGSVAAAGSTEGAAGAVELQELITRLGALPLPADQVAPLAALATRAAQRMASLEKGWDMCQKKRRMQSRYLSQINDLYRDDFHVVPVPMLGEEVRGVDRLRLFAELLLKGDRSLPVGSATS